MFGRKRDRRVQLEPFDLRTPLLRLSARDEWTIGDACEGTQIFGATGSGKTSGSGQAIAKAMLSAGFGGLVLTAKPDERALWERYGAETGRSNSLMVFGADTPHRFNFLDYELRRSPGAGLTENLVALFTTVLDAAEGQAGGNSADPFWPRALRQLMRNTIDLMVLARGRVSLPEMAALVASAPQSVHDVGDPDWQARSMCWACIEQADERTVDPGRRADLDVTAGYWLGEFPALADRTRSSIVATFTTMADGMIRGTLRELFCTETTVVPEVTHEGVVLVIDLPVKVYHELGRFAQILWKYCWQRATEARDTSANPRPVFLWADEAQLFVTALDNPFQETARSARACTVYLTQNLPNYYHALGGGGAGGGGGKHAVDALLGVLATKIMHANGDTETNEWAERMVAKRWQAMASTSAQDRDRDPRNMLGPRRSVNTSTSKQLNSELLAREFTMMRRGGPRDGFLVDAVVFQGGRRWRGSGTNFIRTTFSQR